MKNTFENLCPPCRQIREGLGAFLVLVSSQWPSTHSPHDMHLGVTLWFPLLWLWLICLCWLIFCNKYTTVTWDVDGGDGCECVWWAGHIQEFSTFPAQFCGEPKTALQKLSLLIVFKYRKEQRRKRWDHGP